MIIVGVDLGTAAIKVVFVKNQVLIWSGVISTGPEHFKLCSELIAAGLKALSIKKEDIAGIVTTGYGKHLFPKADKTVDEISANTAGANILSERRARVLVNIGGQDVKMVNISPDGKVVDFKMNDKCAAGTGRFFEMAERILDIPLEKFGDLSTLSQSPVYINSTCAVFAETELVSLVSKGVDRNDIIAGIHQSIARRIADLIKNASMFEEEIYLDGGPAANRGLVLAMEDELMKDIKVFPQPQFTVAFGATMCYQH